MTEPPLLQLRDLVVSLRSRPEVRAVDGVDLTVAPGEAVALVGESGSGKSVTGYSTLGLLGPALRATGELEIGGERYDLARPESLRALRGDTIGMVFQDPGTSLNPVMPVGRQIGDVLRRHTSLDRQQRRGRAVELLAQVGVAAPDRVVHAYPFELSGGMRQRVLIAMALCCQPRLLIADEPTTALDTTVQAQIMELLAQLLREQSMAMLFIAHDLGLVAEACQRMYVMYAGRVVESGPVDQVIARPRHPYTEALIKCRPTGARQVERLTTIAGAVPSIDAIPTGCRFAPRCPVVMPQCHEIDPALRPVGGAVSAACLRAEQPA